MTHLVFTNEQDAIDSLDAVNNNYSCEYSEDNGYIMHRWDVIKKHPTENKWSFAKPQVRFSKTVEQLMQGVTGYTEETLDSSWTVEDGV